MSPLASEPALQVEGVSKKFAQSKDRFAVHDLSFSVARGEIVGLLGPNGAGKTTTIRMIISVLRPDSGTIRVMGHSLANERSAALQHVAFASTYTNLPLFLTVEENLDIHGRIYGLPAPARRERIEEMLTRFRAHDHRHKRVGQLSAGERTRVMLARAFLPRPTIALLDEPTASLDPDIAQEVQEFVATQREEDGTSILFSSHNMEEVTELCDRVVFLRAGKILAVDTPRNLAAEAGGSIVELEPAATESMLQLLKDFQYTFVNTEKSVSIEVHEGKEAELFIQLSRSNISYSRVTIHRPSLEDYFLMHAKPSGQL